MQQIEQCISWIGNNLSDYILLPLLMAAAIYFTLRTRGVQFRMIGEMCHLLVSKGTNKHGISSFQAFMVSIASRVGTGNLAGVATAIVLGGPGAVFWMWVIALLGASSAFIESTLAQLFKVDDGNGNFRGGPAYYILHGIGSKTWAITFAVLISVTFGLAYNSVQCNTITEAFHTAWSVPQYATSIIIAVLTLVIIWGGIKSIARFSQWVVPIMAVAYLIVAAIIVCLNIEHVPTVFMTIIENAFGFNQAMGGTVGSAMAMGIRRGLFSNEAGEGSAPNVAATAHVSHPVKQGLVQALGVFTDTLLICSCTAFIILCSGVHIGSSAEGISLTQRAVDSQFSFLPGFGSMFVSFAILFFAFTSIVANYYYGETNVRFITKRPAAIYIYRIAVTAMVLIGGVSSLSVVWSLADITMSLMAICNLFAIIILGKYAVRCLNDYTAQRRAGKDPQYSTKTNPDIAPRTPCW
jgi:AGCS family alanine or glycine:cation symporter